MDELQVRHDQSIGELQVRMGYAVKKIGWLENEVGGHFDEEATGAKRLRQT
jgi:hypothetical protein